MASGSETLVERFKTQINQSIDGYTDDDPKCAYGAGMLVILSALRRFDGSSLPMQIAAMHVALRQVGEERGWKVAKGA